MHSFRGRLGNRRLIGGYRGFGFGLYTYMYLQTATSIALLAALSRGRRCYAPWYLRPPPRYAPDSLYQPTDKPIEKWPVVVFDCAKSGFCSRLDRTGGAAKHDHVVPMDQFDIVYDVWEAPLTEDWDRTKPTSHESVAAMIVTYNVKDRASLATATSFIRSAQAKLTENEYDTYAALMVVLIGVTDVDGSSAPTISSSEGLAAAGQNVCVLPPLPHPPDRSRSPPARHPPLSSSAPSPSSPRSLSLPLPLPLAPSTLGSPATTCLPHPLCPRSQAEPPCSLTHWLTHCPRSQSLFFEAPCSTVAAVHDCMVSIGQEVFTLAERRRAEEYQRDQALSRVHTSAATPRPPPLDLATPVGHGSALPT